MTVKILCAAAIILSCSYIGIKLSDFMHKRVRSLTEILSVVGHIESCISTIKMPLAEIYQTLAQTKGRIGEFFSGLKAGENWNGRIDIFTGLTVQDKKLICDLSDKLGAYESSRQIDEIKMTKSLLSDQLINAKKDVADNSKTYRAMSFFAGVVIAILLV